MYCADASRFQARLTEVGVSYSDCPVSGMPFRAENGTLTMMFGGNEGAFEHIRPYLDVMDEFIVSCGEMRNRAHDEGIQQRHLRH